MDRGVTVYLNKPESDSSKESDSFFEFSNLTSGFIKDENVKEYDDNNMF